MYVYVCVCCLHVCPVLMLHFYWVSVLKKYRIDSIEGKILSIVSNWKYPVSATPTRDPLDLILSNHHDYDSKPEAHQAFQKLLRTHWGLRKCSRPPPFTYNLERFCFYTSLVFTTLVGFIRYSWHITLFIVCSPGNKASAICTASSPGKT